MTVTSIGDLARGLTLRARSVQIKSQIDTLTKELSTGRTSDVTGRLKGDYSHLAELDRGLRRLDAFKVATSEAALLTTAMQQGAETVQDRAERLSNDVITLHPFGQAGKRAQVASNAAQDLQTMVAALNVSAGGRAVFSGVETDTSPLADHDTLLTGLRSAISGQPSVADMMTAARDWFSDPSGFEAQIYRGADRNLAPTRLSETDTVSPGIRADAAAFRDVLRSTALLALSTDPGLGLTSGEQAELIDTAGGDLLAGRDGLTALRAEIGFDEARIADAQAQNSAARTSLDYARNELVAADPFDVVTRLEAAQFQLESLYSATVRTANLSLVNFLR
ncbi:flagellar hook-associated protein 3 FlgL [Cribrihabitans marinus]|uniref:Flagellar hook-associated protein 3 FlgL n=1 Tax=Cribrihabitans marinus TaxID=1227549 RepID=A0A1H7DHJ0_9RHOB|nr:flagellin [Cribrihabitans marinus]GGH39376.1 flagellar hook protein FlgL [Cribrihabitans marinus]SEK01196.1 flagellar hook-associated protein 3 FlgL [Cribrihabitans marinus]